MRDKWNSRFRQLNELTIFSENVTYSQAQSKYENSGCKYISSLY